MFASNGQYSATHSKIVEVDLGQLQTDSLAEELDHEYKYRFLYVSDDGEIISLYNPNQPTQGGGGDLLLEFTGHPGSGFEHCEKLVQTLTKGSQF